MLEHVAVVERHGRRDIEDPWRTLDQIQGRAATRLAGSPLLTAAEAAFVRLIIAREHGRPGSIAAAAGRAGRAGVPRAVRRSVLLDRELDDVRWAALAACTREMPARRGRVSRAAVGALFRAGYGERQLLALVLCVALEILENARWSAGDAGWPCPTRTITVTASPIRQSLPRCAVRAGVVSPS